MTNQRQKGIRGELEWRDELRAHGYDAERGQQRAGGGDSPDVAGGIPGTHVEVKRTEAFRLYDAVNQARRDSAGTGKIPYVAHRCNSRNRVAATVPPTGHKDDCRGQWLIVLGSDDFFRIMAQAGYTPGLPV